VQEEAGDISYRDTQDVDIFQLARLFEQAGWHHRTHDLGQLARLVSGSTYVVSAWRKDLLVGFARAISDCVSNAYISTVAIAEHEGQKEILRELLRRLMQGRDEITFVLQAQPTLVDFFTEEGFEPAPHMYQRPRRSPKV
jgi:predicted GNAT family N-acyltransferase